MEGLNMYWLDRASFLPNKHARPVCNQWLMSNFNIHAMDIYLSFQALLVIIVVDKKHYSIHQVIWAIENSPCTQVDSFSITLLELILYLAFRVLTLYIIILSLIIPVLYMNEWYYKMEISVLWSNNEKSRINIILMVEN